MENPFHRKIASENSFRPFHFVYPANHNSQWENVIGLGRVSYID